MLSSLGTERPTTVPSGFPMSRETDEDPELEVPVKKSEGKQLLASELMTRIRNKGFANTHGRLAQTGEWICLQLLIESMEAALRSRQLRDLQVHFAEKRASVSDRFELLALTLLQGMSRARLELPEGLVDSRKVLENLQRRDLARILRREIGSKEEISARASGATVSDRYDALAEGVLANVQTWESAHEHESEAGDSAETPSDHPQARTRFIAEFLRAELREGLPSISADPMGYFVNGSGAPFQSGHSTSTQTSPRGT
jgi:hypothetical protein